MFGARVGQRDGVADTGGFESIASKQFAIKTVEVGYGRVVDEESGHLVERGGALGAFDIERDARGGEK